MRTLAAGAAGWDVAGLQFLLARHGFPSGAVDGVLGPRTDAAVRRFQSWAGLAAVPSPPATSTLPFVSSVAVRRIRAVAMLPALDQLFVTGSYNSAVLCTETS
jgi:peptidoglycan hydrolase-like protein with peptidoglycan-binding domain